MGSLTVSTNYNGIDWNSLLDAVIAQESQPLKQLSAQRANLQAQSQTYGRLASRLSTLQSTIDDLKTKTVFQAKKATNTNASALTVTTNTSSTSGTYDIVVNELARAQVTASASTAPDPNTTIVASGGSITIGGVSVTLPGSVTLQGLADAINTTAGIGVVAAVVQAGANTYRLVLTGKSTGSANAFTITNSLTGGTSPVTFTDTNANGISGDSAADNSVTATDASVTVNNVTVTSATNVITDAIPGASIEVLKKDPLTTITVGISQDLASTKDKIKAFVAAYNSFIAFTNEQTTASRNGVSGAIGRDGLLRTLRTTLNQTTLGDFTSAGSTFTRLSEVGVEFQRDGTLKFNETRFDAATASGTTDVEKLFAGNDSTISGAFDTLSSAIVDYTKAGGLLPLTQDRVTTQAQSMAARIDAMQQRLDIRRAALQREYMAADQAMTTLKAQGNGLATLGSGYRLF